MWHDGQFTYLRSNAQESPALYEIKDGKPALVAYDITEDGLYVSPGILLGDGWLQIGKERAQWKLESTGDWSHDTGPMETDSRTSNRRIAGRSMLTKVGSLF